MGFEDRKGPRTPEHLIIGFQGETRLSARHFKGVSDCRQSGQRMSNGAFRNNLQYTGRLPMIPSRYKIDGMSVKPNRVIRRSPTMIPNSVRCCGRFF